jgi:carbon-monoxide dehydrogenase medium subunit
LRPIEYVAPKTVEEAVAALAEKGEAARPLAGGTDILVQMRGGRRLIDRIVDVKKIPELNELSYDPASGLTIGAAVECYKIYEDAAVMANYPALVDCTSIIGGIQIQGRATVGGNLCNAAPSADSIPALIAYGATANIAGPNGTRSVPVEDVCTGPGQSILAANELLVSISVPAPAANSGARYIRFIPRNEMDIAVVGAGVSVELDGDTIKSARVSLASVAPTPLFVREAGDALAGQPISDESIRKASALAQAAAKPITDMRGTIEFRNHLCEVLTRRALNTAIERAKEAS